MSDTPTTAYAHGPGGLLSQPGLGGKRAARLARRVRVKAWSPEARAAALEARRRNAGMASGNAPNADARNLANARREAAQLRKVPKPPKIAAPKHGGGGKGGGKKPKGPKAPKPKKVALTTEQKRAARLAARDQNRTTALQKMNIAPDGQQALNALRQGDQADPQAIARGGFVQAGLVHQAADGSYQLTPSGRAALSAADQGDAGRLGATIASARDRTTAASDRQARIAARRAGKKPAAAPVSPIGQATQGLASQARVAHKAHAMSRDEEKAMFASMGRAGTLRGRTGAAAGGGPARKPTPAETQTHAAIPAKVKPGTTVGDTTKAFGADPNTSYQLRHELVDMKDIEASNTGGGGINPNYDPALQPRDRSRASSQAQIGQVAQNLNPEVLTTDFHRIDAGSPIVDTSGNVLSGNGRTLALQRAAELHPAQYAAYRAAIKAEARAHGIDPAMVDKMENPVLVRRLQGGADPAAFAREANSSGTLRMSPLEQAKVDAGQISDSHMLKLNVTEGQDIDRALRDRNNKPFIDEFLKTVPDNERANLLTRNGDLNQMGLYRAKAAIYTRAFPGESGERLAESMLESLDPEVKSIQNGISGALPSFSHATALTRSGMRDPSLDISEDIAKTIDVYARIKDNPALTAGTPASQLVAKYLGQSSMFDRELNGEQERLLVYLDKISKKPTEVRSFLDRYAKIVEDQPPPGQANLFGDAGNLTRAQLFDTLLGGTQVPEVQNQAGMF